MHRPFKTALLLTIAMAFALSAQENRRGYTTQIIKDNVPVIDGVLNDTAWEGVDWSGEFIQHEPYENVPPTQQTQFKVLYSEHSVYVAIRAIDTEPEAIEARLSRRDDFQGDWVGIQFDSYADRQTAFTFAVTAAGVKADGIFTGDGENEDWTADPIWYVKTSRDSKGWNAEMRIPLSQLRYGDKPSHVWGLEVARYLFRKDEMSLWQPIARNASGWTRHFGELRGIGRLPKARRIELLPYTVAKTERFEADEEDPFLTGRRSGVSAGLDGKIGLTSDLTLDFTISPDFGQVEADPSEVNLSAFETFFEEKRPFFIEGRSILSYGMMMGDGDIANDGLFYSRRIGRRPSHEPDTEDDEYVKTPDNTTILGAAKITGKTQKGLSIGIMNAVTQREEATIDLNGDRRQETVEPLTNYFLGRVKQDFRGGATRLGGILTHTHRKIDEEHLEFLNDNALTAGVDFSHQWKDRTWFVDFKTMYSRIEGSREAMLEQQESSRRYFQRPDNKAADVDSSLTSMQGYGGSLFVGRSGNSHVNFVLGSTWRSPGFEVNDMGYARESDMVLQFTWVGLNWWEPFSIFRNLNVNFNQWYATNWSGDRVVVGGNTNWHAQFKNYWGARVGINYDSEALSTSALRGGPALLYSDSKRIWWGIESDQRQSLTGEVDGAYNRRGDGFSGNWSISGGMSWRPNDQISMTLHPFYSVNKENLQYVDTIERDDGNRYVFGRIHQKTMGLVLRLNCSITPDLSIQLYGQPFVSAGDYSHYKQITDSRAAAYEDRYEDYADGALVLDDDVYHIDEDGDGQSDYSIDKPDFNFRQFNSNLVIRWEYKPGSTLFLVWSQGRTGYEEQGRFRLGPDMNDLFRVHPHNVFLLKFNRWFSL